MSNENLPAPASGYGRAAEKLADTIRHVVDLTAGPQRVIANARAQAEANIVLANAAAEQQEILARAAARIRTREFRRQQNIEAIAFEAAKVLPPAREVSDDPVQPDWTTRFFEECQDVSNDQMQAIWARILAREVSGPGSFSPFTLGVVRNLGTEDAEVFTRLCEFVWEFPKLQFRAPIIHNVDSEHLKKRDLHFGAFTHLRFVGLVEFNNLTGFALAEPNEAVEVCYAGQTQLLRSAQKKALNLGKVLFTAAGLELVAIVQSEVDDSLRVAGLEDWKKEGWRCELGTAEGVAA